MPRTEKHLLIGQAAPDFTFPVPNGRQVRLSEFRGRRVVLLFAVSEIRIGYQAFQQLKEWWSQMEDQSIQVIVIQLPFRAPLLEVDAETAVDGKPPRIVVTGADADTIGRFMIRSTATTVLIDQDQTIRYYRSAFYPTELSVELDRLRRQM